MLSLNQLLNEAPNDATSEDKGKGKRPVPTEDGASDQAGPRKKAAVEQTSAVVNRGEEEEEPHSQEAASNLDAPSLISIIQDYWLKYNPLTESTSNEAVVAKSRDNLHALKRLFALNKELSLFLGSGTSSEDAGRRRTATKLETELDKKFGDLICALQTTNLTTQLFVSDNCDMGIDKEHEVDFRKSMYPILRKGERSSAPEPHASLKVFEMSPEQWKEASKHFIDYKPPHIASNTHKVETNIKAIQRHVLAKTWARLVCLVYKTLPVEDNTADLVKLRAQVSQRMQSRRKALKKSYQDASTEEKDSIKPWEDQRDPEFCRQLKAEFETLFSDGKPIETEPHASEKVTNLAPRQIKEALVWFVDLKEAKVYPSTGDEAKAIRDWKRLVALRHCAVEIRRSTKARELSDPTDSMNKDILEEAEERIHTLASMIKTRYFKHSERPLDFKDTVLKMDRDDSEEIVNAFRDSYDKYVE